ncbi:hypothetical protein ACGFYY_06600 [Streptomyces sp. NPDC048331]|uniref:hypothetical protein n=1 Tax=Streptomyces sp. NPDC048331 TaxID=3365534 RepID=UPI00371719D7
MDEYEEFRNLARAVVGQLHAKGKARTTVSHERVTVEGWIVDHGNSYSSETRYSRALGDWREVWGNNDQIILGTDAELYSYSWGAEEGGHPVVTERHSSLRRLEAKDLVGREGAPFSSYTEKLKRLRWS